MSSMAKKGHEKRDSQKLINIPCAGLPVIISCGFRTLEQRIIWEAVVFPEITDVLAKYAELLSVSVHE